MKRELQKNPAKSKSDLIEKIFQIWNGIQPEMVQKLISGMFKRSYSVLKANGGHGKY